jgi:hypothetical protein
MSADVTMVGGASAQAREQEGGAQPVDERPRSVYEIVTRQMLEEVRGDVAEVKGRVNALLWLVAGAVLLDWIMRLVG